MLPDGTLLGPVAMSVNDTVKVFVLALCRPMIATCEVPLNAAYYSVVYDVSAMP